MRAKGLVLAVMAAGVLLWCTHTPERVEPGQADTERVAPEDATTEPARGESEPPRVSGPVKGKPSLEVERVAFDRRPWDPTEELKELYELRAETIVEFDRFRQEAGLSDERAQKLVMILYDYQQNKRLISEDIHEGSPYRDQWEFEGRVRAASVLSYMAGVEGHERIADMLSPDELRAWRRFVHRSNIFWKLTAQIPLFRPVSSQ